MAPPLLSGVPVMSEKLSFDLDAFSAKYGGVTTSKYEKDRVVHEQGLAEGGLFYILKGEVQLTVVSEQGKERVVGIRNTGDFFGEGCLSDHLLSISSATTLTESVIARLEKPAVARALHEDVHFSEFFVSYLLGRNRQLMDDLIDQLFNSSERRLARVLLLLGNFEKDDRKVEPLAHINQETLAKMVGTTRSRVNFFMNKFRRLGYIDYNGRIHVHPSLLNVVLRDTSLGDG
jgi:CRP/FNR family cyclic AMP-dependent transcriptional regulator